MNQKLERLLVWATGFKAKRFEVWAQVVADEGRRAGWLGIVLTMGGAILTLGTRRSAWKSKLAACRRCPIYDKTLKRCRPFAGSDLGCGCYMPFKALSRGAKCWARTKIPGTNLGW